MAEPARVGAPHATAVLAAETARGCYQAARRLGGDDAEALVRQVELGFPMLLRTTGSDSHRRPEPL
ncbi:hypothetical protein ACWDE9_22255 [Streptomyces olivaceoviridis]